MTDIDEPLEATPEYTAMIARHKQFKDVVNAALSSRFSDVLRDTPRGRHNADFTFKEDFFGFDREWIVVTHSGMRLMPHDRAMRIVGSFKEDLERHDIHGVLIITENGIEKFAQDYLANNVGFVHHTLDELRAGHGKQVPDVAVPIDSNHPAYKKVVDGLRNTAEAIRTDNHPNVTPTIRDRLIRELNASVELLKAEEINLELVIKLIMKTLRYVVGQLGGSASSMLAGAAIIELTKLFSLH